MPTPRPRYGVAGHPVAHSLSPSMHRAAYAALGIDADYFLLPIPAELLDETVRAMPASGFAGINVTIPHKESAAAIADSTSEAVKQIGAANTLTFGPDGIKADNTDASGLIAAIDRPVEGLRALVLGAGGTARAAVWALANAGVEVSVWNRTRERASQLEAQFDVVAVEHPTQSGTPDIVVNTTAVGMDPNMSAESSLEALCAAEGLLVGDALPGRQIAIDFVYGTHAPGFTQAALEAGCAVIDGRELLVRQGARSFELWFGREAPLAAMRNAIAG